MPLTLDRMTSALRQDALSSRLDLRRVHHGPPPPATPAPRLHPHDDLPLVDPILGAPPAIALSPRLGGYS